MSQGLCPVCKWAGPVEASEAALTLEPQGCTVKPPWFLPKMVSRYLRCPVGWGSVGQSLESFLQGTLEQVLRQKTMASGEGLDNLGLSQV